MRFFRCRDINDVILNVCHWVRRYRTAKGSTTPRDLYHETGYDACHQQITEADIESVLRNDPQLIDEWELFSMDQRWAPSWWFSRKGEGVSEVGFYHNDQVKRRQYSFTDDFKACAFFIKMMMERLRTMP